MDKYDPEQVRPYLAQYSELRERGLRYNDQFKGKIPEIAGPDEDRLIYLLSNLWAIEQEKRRIADAKAAGFRRIRSGDGGSTKRFAEVILYRPKYYVGGTGEIVTVPSARVRFDASGEPVAVIPKGKRNGYDARGAEVFAR